MQELGACQTCVQRCQVLMLLPLLCRDDLLSGGTSLTGLVGHTLYCCRCCPYDNIGRPVKSHIDAPLNRSTLVSTLSRGACLPLAYWCVRHILTLSDVISFQTFCRAGCRASVPPSSRACLADCFAASYVGGLCWGGSADKQGSASRDYAVH
jgi:hypothetical protein